VKAKSSKKLHRIELEFPNGITRTVKAKAATREKAEQRALKFNPAATGVKRGN
jgi:hypothetical protein